MNADLVLQLITGAMIGLGAGYLGSFMVLRRMSLVGDALSHVALPGIAVALLLHISPFAGAFTALLIAVLGIWALSRSTALPSETLVGIFFTLALAAGLLLTPKPELLEALFGDISSISLVSTVVTVAAILLMVGVMRHIQRTLMLDIVSRDLARSVGAGVERADLLFLVLVALVVALGLKIAGTVLTGSLVIIPAAAARNASHSLTTYTWLSGALGAFCAVAGIAAAHVLGIQPGPAVIIAGAVVFCITLVARR